MLLEAIFWCKNIQLFVPFIILLPCTKMPCSHFFFFLMAIFNEEKWSAVTLIHLSALFIGLDQLKLQHLSTGVQVSLWSKVPQEFMVTLKVPCSVNSPIIIQTEEYFICKKCRTTCYMVILPLSLRTLYGPSLIFFVYYFFFFFFF